MSLIALLIACGGEPEGAVPAPVPSAGPSPVAPSPTLPIPPEAPPLAFSVPPLARQVVVVTTEGWDTPIATLARFNRTEGGWAPAGGPVPAVVGRTGLGWGRGLHPVHDGIQKAEGDGRAPAGVFRLGDALGYAAALPEPAEWPYRESQDGMLCVDDVASVSYNRIVGPDAPRDWKSAEVLTRKDALYRWLVLVDHNGLLGAPAVPGGGSCIFLHVWRAAEKGTDGCTAAAEQVLLDTLQWLSPAANPVLVQLPREEYEARRAAWGLP